MTTFLGLFLDSEKYSLTDRPTINTTDDGYASLLMIEANKRSVYYFRIIKKACRTSYRDVLGHPVGMS